MLVSADEGGGGGFLDRMWDPIAYALGFLDCNDIVMLFVVRTETGILRMLEGSQQIGLQG